MGFWRQFDNFKPMTGQIPYSLFAQLNGILWRARHILRGRTDEQVERIAQVAGNMIDDYFKTAKEDEIRRLREEKQHKYLVGEGTDDMDLNPDLAHELDFPTEENTEELDALSESVGSWSDVFEAGEPDPENHEYFAAFALWHVGDVINDLLFDYDYKTHKYVAKDKLNGKIKEDSYTYRNAAEDAIIAMHAVCESELMRDTERLKEDHRKILAEVKAHTSLTVQKEIDAKWEAQRLEEDRRKSEHAREKARLSHRERDEMRALVVGEWEKNPTQFRSAERAGNYYVDWLHEEHKKEYQPRTVIGWIRQHAKEKNIRLR